MSLREILASRERSIKEMRQNEAIKKKLIGLEGKLGQILKAFGEKIMHHDAEWDDYDLSMYANSNDLLSTIIEADEVTVTPIGMSFNALSYGVNLEIQYVLDLAQITVHYQGTLVYQETAGDLDVFVPSPAWEDPIDRFFAQAQNHLKKQGEINKEARKVESKAVQESFLKQMLNKWGFT